MQNNTQYNIEFKCTKTRIRKDNTLRLINKYLLSIKVIKSSKKSARNESIMKKMTIQLTFDYTQFS